MDNERFSHQVFVLLALVAILACLLQWLGWGVR